MQVSNIFAGLRNVVILLFCFGHAWSATVTIQQGRLKGVRLQSRGGRGFHSFLGIPYAKPPLGDLRFQAPVPHPGWEGERDASQEGAMCLQQMTLIPRFLGTPFGEEDCLYINVHTPQNFSSSDSGKKLPVLVWIYGGAFQMGDSGSGTYGPFYLMDREVVYVNFNYRLGVMGFLSFETASVPGNFGLKDQRLALQWVKDNIEAFGGDPASVTIFGESAGAASVHYHLVAPPSQGLFHRAILQSGSSFCPWALVPQGLAKERARAFATLLGCYGNEAQTVQCLREVPVDTILATQLKFVEWGRDPIISFAPVIEPPHPASFISMHPIQYKTNPSIPLVIGVNQDEGAIRTAKLCSEDMLELSQLNGRWGRYLPLTMLLTETVERAELPKVVEAVTQYYLGGAKVDRTNIRSLSDMYSDLLINQATMKAAEHHSGPVYFYLYGYRANITWSSVFGNCPIELGVTHADEMINLFNLDSLFEKNNLEGNDLAMSSTLLALWTNFADKGVPTDDAGRIQWTRFDSSSGHYLHLGQNEIRMKERLFQDRLRFVESLPLAINKFEDSGKANTNEKTEL